MSWLLGALDGWATALFDRILDPALRLGPLPFLVTVGVVTGIGAMIVFRTTSNQARLRVLRDRMSGNLLAVWLYRHDPRVVLGLQGEILRDAARRIGLTAVPALVLAVPLGLLLGQLNLRFAVGPLPVGHSTVLSVRWEEEVPARAELITSPAVEVDAGVRIDPDRKIFWRIRGREPGLHRVRVASERGSVDKFVAVGDGWGAVSQVRAAGPGALWLNPGEAPIPQGLRIGSIEVRYPPRPLSILGVKTSWPVIFAIAAVVGGLAGGRVLRVAY